jgi:hypothetical protein
LILCSEAVQIRNTGDAKMKLRCGHEASVWKEEPPTTAHAYRVECAVCPHRFEKWGTEVELLALRATGAHVTVVPHNEPKPEPGLDEFFED